MNAPESASIVPIDMNTVGHNVGKFFAFEAPQIQKNKTELMPQTTEKDSFSRVLGSPT
jgi:hypothetical protein